MPSRRPLPRTHRPALASVLAVLTSSVGAATAHGAAATALGYPNAAAAFAAVRARGDAEVSLRGDWFVIRTEGGAATWFFTRQAHRAHPAAVVRRRQAIAGGEEITTDVLCEAAPNRCATLPAEARALDTATPSAANDYPGPDHGTK